MNYQKLLIMQNDFDTHIMQKQNWIPVLAR